MNSVVSSLNFKQIFKYTIKFLCSRYLLSLLVLVQLLFYNTNYRLSDMLV